MSPQLLDQALNATDVKSGFIEHLCEVLNLSLSDLYDESTNKNNFSGIPTSWEYRWKILSEWTLFEQTF